MTKLFDMPRDGELFDLDPTPKARPVLEDQADGLSCPACGRDQATGVTCSSCQAKGAHALHLDV